MSVEEKIMGYRNGKKVPVSYNKDDSYKRKVSETLKRTWANRSEAYIEKRNNKISVVKWNQKSSSEAIENVKKGRELRKKFFKIVPREKNYAGVVIE